MKNIKQEGSVTAPLCMVVLVIAALLFTLVESARYYGLKSNAEKGGKLAAESLFAGYQPFLLEEYGMFFLDGNFGSSNFQMEGAEDEIRAFLCENFITGKEQDGIDLYRMQAVDAEVTGYMLATDAKGKVFEMKAAKAMKQKLGEQAAKKILEEISGVKKQTENTENPEEAIAGADAALKEIAAAEEEKKESADQKEKEQGMDETEALKLRTAENPLEIVKKLQKEGILALVVPSGNSVSEKRCNTKDSLLKRNCRKGTWECRENSGWYERILMQEFLKPLSGNAVAPQENGSLSYGTEYLICGKEGDRENLKGVVKKILLLREILNYVYLQTDESRKAEARTVASAIAGALVSPELISIIEQGVLAAWSYVESICDVKALLSGGKIPIIKTSDSWHTQLSNLSSAIENDYTGEAKGVSYENYLDILLYEKTVKQIAYRSMDLMEWRLKEQPNGENCRMDHMVTGIRFTAEYDTETLFFDIFGKDTVGGYRFTEKEEYIYGP